MADNPWLERRVLNYAHQGGAKEEPSSTLHAIRTAIDNGATAIELDVHMSADGHLVVCHDATVDRTTEGTGPIATLPIEEVRRLDNSYWFAPASGEQVAHDRDVDDYVYRGLAVEDPAFRIALLDEVLEEFRGVFLNFDIKQTAPDVTPYEHQLADAIRAHNRAEDVIVASFHDVATDRFREYAPEIATSAGTNATAAFYFATRDDGDLPPTPYVALQVPRTFGETVVVDERFVERAHGAGIAVHVWTIDDRDEMEQLCAVGVDGIITDRPSLLTEVLAEEGLTYYR